MDLDINSLHVFARAADLGNFSAVAIDVGQSQSAVSKRISSLEAHFGGRLFVRTGRGVVLSDLGHELLPLVKDLLNRANQISDYGKARSRVPSGDVRVGLSTSFYFLAADLYRDVARQYPEVSLYISEGFGLSLEQSLSQASLDIATITLFSLDERGKDEVVGEYDTYLAAPIPLAAARNGEINFSDLQDLPLALPQTTDYFRQHLEKQARQFNVRLNVVVEVDSTRMLNDLVSRASIYTLQAPYALESMAKSEKVSLYRVVNPNIRRFVTLRYATSRPSTIATKLVAQMLRQKLQACFVRQPLPHPYMT